MRELRILDRMAIIGSVLAILAIGLPITYTGCITGFSERKAERRMRTKVLDCMPTPDMRADLDIAGMWNLEISKEKRLTMIREAVKKYPNSARLQFRLGMATKAAEGTNALRRAAQLDPENAMPLYMLASQAAERKSWDEAVSLLRRANRLPRVDRYAFPYEACKGDGLLEMELSAANSSSWEFSSLSQSRRLALYLSQRASQLHAAGRTKQAVSLLGDVRVATRRIMRMDGATAIDVLVGESMIILCSRPEKAIALATGEATLARLAAQEKERVYIKAGVRAYLDQSMEELVRRVTRFSALGTPMAIAGYAQAVLVIFSFVWWAVLVRRSRGTSASELHPDAARRAFHPRRLMKVYVVVILCMVILTVALVKIAGIGRWEMLAVVWYIGPALAAIPALAIAIWASRAYKRAFVAAAASAGEEVPKPWRGYSAADKRERQRVLTGVLGGAMISLVVWFLILSAYMKATMNAFPWQVERATAGMRAQETRYIADLVAGKIKVPEKYIRQVEQDRARKPKPGGG